MHLLQMLQCLNTLCGIERWQIQQVSEDPLSANCIARRMVLHVYSPGWIVFSISKPNHKCRGVVEIISSYINLS